MCHDNGKFQGGRTLIFGRHQWWDTNEWAASSQDPSLTAMNVKKTVNQLGERFEKMIPKLYEENVLTKTSFDLSTY